MKNIVKNDNQKIDFFANSFLIEASKKEIINDIKYISFNNSRKEKYRLITIIKDGIVEKIPDSDKSVEHIKNMAEIIKDIKSQNIEILDYEENQKIYSKFINQETLDKTLGKEKDIEKIIEILNKYKEFLLKQSSSYEECKNYINQEEYKEIGDEELKKLSFLKKGYWDMVPKNCFLIDSKFIFFDQEWEKDYLPVEFILYRAIINSYDLVKRINVEELFEKLKIKEYINCFEEMDKKLRKEILDEEIYKIIYEKGEIKAIDNILNENKSYIEEIDRKDKYIKSLENIYNDVKIDNSKKEKYISELQEDNRKKQEYIDILEEKVNKKWKFFK